MKELVLAVTAASAVLTAPAAAGTLEDFFDGQVFRNKGQCQAALMAERNNRRNNDGNTGSFSDPEYNHVVHEKYECVQVGHREWIVVNTFG